MGAVLATIFSRLVGQQSTATPQNDDIEEEEEISEPAMPQLPDTILRLVFKKLEFRDIKNCRLVCKQWHRHALDNISFMLAMEHVERPASGGSYWQGYLDHYHHLNRAELALFWLVKFIRTVERTGESCSSVWQRLVTPLATLSLDRYRFNLIAFAAWTDDATIRRACEGRDPEGMVRKPATQLHLHQIAGIVNNLKYKIKCVQLFVEKAPESLPILRAVAANLPAAELVCAIHGQIQDNQQFGVDTYVWATFERDKNSVNQIDRAPLKLRRLVIAPGENEHQITPVTCHLFESEAGNLRELNASWSSIHRLLSNYEANSSGKWLIFEECQKLVCFNSSSSPIVSPFLKISKHFPNVQCIRWTMVSQQANLDFDNLEHLTKLKSLSIWNFRESEQFEVPRLRLPSLTELDLRCLLPAKPHWFVSSGLKQLGFNAVAENMRRLAAHAHIGGNNLANLKHLQLKCADARAVQEFLRMILIAAKRLKQLTILRWLPVAEVELVFAVCRIIAEVSPQLTTFHMGEFVVPDNFDCPALVQRIIERMKQAKVEAVVSLMFDDNAENGLSAALLALGASIEDDGFGGTRTTAELSWRSGDVQQKLKLTVHSPDED